MQIVVLAAVLTFKCCARLGSEGRSSVSLTIGKIATLADISPDTLRYYERERLIAPAAKSPGGYRLYERDALRRIRFIKQAQQCGFNLAEIPFLKKDWAGARKRFQQLLSANASDLQGDAAQVERARHLLTVGRAETAEVIEPATTAA